MKKLNYKKVLIGKKLEMSHMWKDNKFIPITKIKLLNLGIVKKKLMKDNIFSYFIGYDIKKSNKINKPQRAMCSGFGDIAFKKYISFMSKENLGEENSLINSFDLYELENNFFNVIATTKGKGFSGVMKRYNFAGGPASHGSSLFHRRPGSICSGETYPAKVLKNQKMPGRHGYKQVTIKNLKIEKLNKEDNIIYIHGSIPGFGNSFLIFYSE